MISSLYIHIPFCAAKCNYCSFNSYAGLDALQERYVDALCGEIENCTSEGSTGSLKTVFIGGGTPSHLSRRLLGRILESCYKSFSIAQNAEISIEVNPGTVDEKTFDFYKRAGLNRISFGVQSFNDRELGRIARIHTAEEAICAVHLAKKAGLKSLSLDLMYGLPGQDAGSWQDSLETAIMLDVNHLSLYQLTIEEGTPLANMKHQGKIRLPDEDTLEAMDEIRDTVTAGAGFDQYEISNYAQPGFQCLHNVNYWENNDYLAAGAGAVAYVNGRRSRNIANPEAYCSLIATGKSVIVEEETLEAAASFRETVIMGLRMNRGVSVPELENRYGRNLHTYYGETLQRLIAENLLEHRENKVSLTSLGRCFANQVMAELV